MNKKIRQRHEIINALALLKTARSQLIDDFLKRNSNIYNPSINEKNNLSVLKTYVDSYFTMNKSQVLKDNLMVVKTRKIRSCLKGQYPSIEQILDRIDHVISQPLTVAVMGEFSAGKSSFLNRLLHIDTLPVSVLPKTATVTRLVYGTEPGIEIEYDDDGKSSAVTKPGYQAFAELQRASKVADSHYSQEFEHIREIRVVVNHPVLNKVHLIDTPGFNHDEVMDQKSLGILSQTDVVIWLADYNQLAKQTEFEKLKLIQEHIPNLYLVINKGDVHIGDSASYQSALADIKKSLADNQFIDFFEKNDLFLISSRSTDAFWDGIFHQFLARFSEAVLSADLRISLSLLNFHYQQLHDALNSEKERYQAIDARLKQYKKEHALEVFFQQSNEQLYKYLEGKISQLMAYLQDYNKNKVKSDFYVVNAFVADYLKNSIYQCFSELRKEYSFFINGREQQYQHELATWLKILGGLIPEYYSELCDRVETLNSYLALETARESMSPDHLLPAVGRTVEVMEHIAWQYEYSQSLSSQWKVNYLRADENAFEIDYLPKIMTLAEYIEKNIRESFEQDYQADLSHILFNPVLHSIIEETEKLCYQAKTCFVTLNQILKE